MHVTPFLESLKSYVGATNVDYVQRVDITNTTDYSGISTAVSAAKEAGLAIVCLGSVSVLGDDGAAKWRAAKWRTDGEFLALPSLSFPGLQQDLLDAILDAGVPTVLVMTGGQGLVVPNSTVARTSAILNAFLADEYAGEALVGTPYVTVNASAKLPITLPPNRGTSPIDPDYLPSDAGSYWSWPILDRANPLTLV